MDNFVLSWVHYLAMERIHTSMDYKIPKVIASDVFQKQTETIEQDKKNEKKQADKKTDELKDELDYDGGISYKLYQKKYAEMIAHKTQSKDIRIKLISPYSVNIKTLHRNTKLKNVYKVPENVKTLGRSGCLIFHIHGGGLMIFNRG